MSQNEIEYIVKNKSLDEVRGVNLVSRDVPYEPIDVIVPRGVERIGYRALAEIPIASLTLPSSLMYIHSNAFSFSEIQDVVIPEGVTYIGPEAFDRCGIKTLKLPSTLRTISGSAFIYNKITKVEIPGSVRTIGPSAFQNCSLREVRLAGNIWAMSGSAFSNNPKCKVSIGGKAVFTAQGKSTLFRVESDGLRNLSGRKPDTQLSRSVDTILNTPVEELFTLDVTTMHGVDKFLKEIITARLKGLV